MAGAQRSLDGCAWSAAVLAGCAEALTSSSGRRMTLAKCTPLQHILPTRAGCYLTSVQPDAPLLRHKSSPKVRIASVQFIHYGALKSDRFRDEGVRASILKPSVEVKRSMGQEVSARFYSYQLRHADSSKVKHGDTQVLLRGSIDSDAHSRASVSQSWPSQDI